MESKSIYISSPVCRTGVMYVLLYLEVTPDIDLDSICLFVCFVALRPMSTAMVIAGRSVHLTTLFPGQA